MRIDIDGFGALNTKLGYGAADGILADVATVVRASLRATDVAARVGPDEFALILPETGREGATVAATNLCKAVKAQSFTVDDHKVRVTVSCGGVELGKDDTDEALFEAAGKALAEAQGRGGNTVMIAGG